MTASRGGGVVPHASCCIIVRPTRTCHRCLLASMNGYNFTERVRKILAMARQESGRLNHEYVGTEHILLGLAREGEGVAAAVLRAFDVDPERLINRIDRVLKKGRSHDTGPDLPYTSRAKKVLELAMTEARELNHSYVGTEHVLLGLIREEKGVAAQVLLDEGVTLDRARTEVLRLLDSEPSRRDRKSKPMVRVSGVVADADSGTERSGSLSPRRAKTLLLADWATDRARMVIGRARAAAANRHSRDIEPEHLLIALLQEEGGMAATVLAHLGIDRATLARLALGAVEETLATDEPFELELSYADSTESALRHAFHAARVARERRVGTDHLLEGLLLEENTPAARLLGDAGLTAEAVREERARIIG